MMRRFMGRFQLWRREKIAESEGSNPLDPVAFVIMLSLAYGAYTLITSPQFSWSEVVSTSLLAGFLVLYARKLRWHGGSSRSREPTSSLTYRSSMRLRPLVLDPVSGFPSLSESGLLRTASSSGSVTIRTSKRSAYRAIEHLRSWHAPPGARLHAGMTTAASPS